MYYACFLYKDGHVEKVKFENREDARKYISDNYDELEHQQVWTE